MRKQLSSALLALALSFALSGCDRSSPAQKPKAPPVATAQPPAPEKPDPAGNGKPEPAAEEAQTFEVKVIADPAEVDALRKRFQTELEARVKTALDSIAKGQAPQAEQLFALKRNKAGAIDALKAIVEDDRSGDDALTLAARYLTELGETKGETFLFEAIKSNDKPSLAAAALRQLSEGRIRAPFKADLLADRLYELMDDRDPRVAEAASALAADCELRKTEAKLVERLTAAQPPENALALARILARVTTLPESGAAALDQLRSVALNDIKPEDIFAFESLIHRLDADSAAPARARLLEYLSAKYQGDARKGPEFVRLLAIAADRSAIPELETLASDPANAENRLRANEALARLEPEMELERLFDDISKNGFLEGYVPLIERLAGEDDAEAVIDLLSNSANAKTSTGISLGATKLLLTKYGEDGEEAVLKHWDELAPWSEALARWKRDDLHVEPALDELKAAGIIAEGKGLLIAKLQAERRKAVKPARLDLSDPATLLEALGAAGIVVALDGEGARSAFSYVKMILLCSDLAGAKLAVEAAVADELPAEKSADGALVRVRVVVGGKLYEFGDAPGVSGGAGASVPPALNRILELTGAKERFLAIEPLGSTRSALFADPQALAPIAAIYGPPIDE